ncbi:hypothetical protein MIND_00654400 [Mycena indigotica]|uniref:Uncharacterized protein n=1 Tax=Mycena indigotica TaxID=2126181 RepID=A0A8H6SRL0_9AGAR|nr:uncharacterized protein MIND_00654400 [Mycena indigotica]KAF7304221.1 hypothetical protein MIND_00654400 [Mycena indigotica]
MIALESVASVVVIGVLYGLCAGLPLAMVARGGVQRRASPSRAHAFPCRVGVGGMGQVMTLAGACVFVLLILTTAVRRDARCRELDTETRVEEKAPAGLGSENPSRLSLPLEVEEP